MLCKMLAGAYRSSLVSGADDVSDADFMCSTISSNRSACEKNAPHRIDISLIHTYRAQTW